MKLIKNEWEVKQIPLKQARPFVEEHHYAHGGGNTAVACFGLFYKGDPNTLHGISWWMPPALGAAKSVSQDHRSVLGLSRFCLVEGRPENAGSFLIGRSIRKLDKRWKTLLTYADTALNHDGGLYYASNWAYQGLTKLNPIYTNSEGVMVSSKRGPKSYNRKQMLEMGNIFLGKFAKHKFVYPVGGRSNLVVKPRVPDQPLLFTHEGKITLGKNEKK